MKRNKNPEDILRIISSQIKNRAYIDRAADKIRKNDKNNNKKINNEERLKILISIMLSARTKDELTEKIAEKLFKNYSISDLEKISVNQISKLIYPVGFYNVKAKNIKRLIEKINKYYNGKVPDNIQELLKLPGIGRKTANLYLSVVHKKPAICVDTHVHRISNRIGFVKTKNPFETEKALEKVFKKNYWSKINEVLVPFGKEICKPINPKCEVCRIKDYCRYYKDKINKRE